MHELSIALSILDIAAEEVERNGGGSVVAIRLRLGLLSGVAREALEGSFAMAREGTALERTELIIDDIPPMAYCRDCAAERAPSSAYELLCPVCGAAMPDIIRGRELEVVALEVDS